MEPILFVALMSVRTVTLKIVAKEKLGNGNSVAVQFCNFVKTLKIRVKLILNCPRAHAITYTNWLFHVVALLTTAKKCTKEKRKSSAGRAKLLFLPTKYTNL